MENKTEELIAKIKQAKANRVKAIEKAKMEEERMYDNYQAEFSKLGERINTLITLGRTLLLMGLPIGEKYYECGFYYDKFVTDSIHHNIGFVINHRILEGVGIKGGGCCGGDLCVGADGYIAIDTNAKVATTAAATFYTYAFKYAMSYHESNIMMYSISREFIVIETTFIIFLANGHIQL